MDVDWSRGMHWIGHPGTLVPFIDSGQTGVVDEVEPVVQAGMGGGLRVRVNRGRPPRSWGVTVPRAHGDSVKHLRTLVTATLPPYVFVSAEAQVTNVLTPEASVMSSSFPELSMGGYWPIAGEYEGGGALVRLNPSAMFGAIGLVNAGRAPVPPSWTGRKVTLTCKLATARAAGAHVTARWLDAAGASFPLAGVPGSAVTGMDGLRLSTFTATPPAGAVAVELLASYAEVVAEPQVTWTDGPVEWTPGNGADAVVFSGLSREVLSAAPDSRNDRRASYDVKLIEAGP